MLGAGAAAALWIITGISGRFSAFPEKTAEMPVAFVVVLLCMAAVLYLVAIRTGEKSGGEISFSAVFAIGLLMRAAGLVSHPVLEDDYFRYLWDGAVTASGANPYLFSPSEVVTGNAGDFLKSLAGESGGIAGRINHPHLTTIYPPATQAFFAVSHLVSEWSVTAWRVLLLAADTATLFILRRLVRGRANTMIYWWNPLVVFTIFFSCHLEALLFPFLLAAVLAAENRRGFAASFFLSLSVSIKIWTALLIVPLARIWREDMKKMLSLFAVFVPLSAVMLLPLIASSSVENSGLTAYAQSWENNSSFFRITLFVSETVAEMFGFHIGHGQFTARVATAFMAVCGAGYAFFSKRWESGDLVGRCLFVSALLFLIVPTQFPWYYCWVVPFLALRKSGAMWSLLSLTAFLPLYYAQYGLSGQSALREVIVWVEFVPVWIMIVFENMRTKT